MCPARGAVGRVRPVRPRAAVHRPEQAPAGPRRIPPATALAGVDDRVLGHDAADSSVPQIQGAHGTLVEPQVRARPAGHRHHRRRQVDAKRGQPERAQVDRNPPICTSSTASIVRRMSTGFRSDHPPSGDPVVSSERLARRGCRSRRCRLSRRPSYDKSVTAPMRSWALLTIRRAQRSNTDQQMSSRNLWSSSTSSRIASGSWSRCHRHSSRPAASLSPSAAAARAALIA